MSATTSARIDHARGLYYDGIRDGKPRDAVAAHTGARYTQHSTGVPDGQEGFIEFFEGFLERNPERDIQVLRAIEDGRHVFLHAYQSLNGGEAQWVTMDFFDTDEDELVVEHWDVIVPFTGPGPSGRSQVDGPTEVTDLARTEENKALVRAMIQDLLMPGGRVDRVADYVAEDYRQHNAELPDGRDALRALLEAEDRPLWYDEIVLLVGQGNFVATLCRARRQGQEHAQADLFRLENGRIVERWDAAEPVPPREEWANSGKF